jgi:hypothetical protein
VVHCVQGKASFTVYSVQRIVRELMGRVCNVVLIKCILDLGKPKRGWNLGGRVHGPGEEQGELVYQQPGTEVDDSCHS